MQGGGLSACNVGNGPTRTGESVLEFGQTSADPFGGGPFDTYLQYWLASPFHHWGYRESALVSDANYVPGTLTGITPRTTPFDLRLEPLLAGAGNFVRYQSVHAYWQRGGEGSRLRDLATQHEVLLFARDPEEHFQALAALRNVTNPPPGPVVSISDGIRIEFQASRLPSAASMVYPPRPNWNTRPPFAPNPGPAPVFATYETSDFWEGGAQPSGPAAAPFFGSGGIGHGSVKAVHVVNHGICSKRIAYTRPDGRGLLGNSNVASVIHATTDREDAQHPGFFFHFSLALRDVAGPLGVTLNATAEMFHGYEFKLLDGILTADPLKDYGAATTSFLGVGAADVKDDLEGALLTGLTSAPGEYNVPDTLSAQVFDAARKEQEFPGIVLGDGFACDPRAPGDESIVVSGDPTQGVCGELFRNIRTNLDAARTGSAFARLGIPTAANSAFKQLWENTALSAMPNARNASERIYQHFKCVPRAANGGNVCRYTIPARRINALPDAVELVFVDDDKEYTNPAFIPFLVLLEAGQITPTTGLTSMCDPPTEQTPGLLGRRPFALSKYDLKTLRATNCVFDAQANRYRCDVVVQ